MEDKAIVDCFWARDQLAIIESKKKYGALCRGIAYRLIQNSEDAAECENDTYLRAWNSIPTARPNRLDAFLCRIVRNLSLDVLDKKKAAKRGGGAVEEILDELDECSLQLRQQPDDGDNRHLAQVLDSFLEQMPKSARVYFMQRYWMGYSIKEIARFGNVSQGKVKMSLMRTRQALRRRLEQEGIDYVA